MIYQDSRIFMKLLYKDEKSKTMALSKHLAWKQKQTIKKQTKPLLTKKQRNKNTRKKDIDHAD